MSVREAKHRIGDIWRLGHLLQWPLTGQNPEFAFWRGNRNTPALSIFADGQMWKDQATGESGDMVAMLARVEGISPGEACARIVRIAEGVAELPPPPMWRPAKTREEKRANWPTVFATLDDHEISRLTIRRKFPHFVGVRAASERGLLVRAVGYDGDPWPVEAWGITDASRESVQIRRMDGKPWKVGKSKSYPGSLGGWPIGIAEVGDRNDIVLTEGEPDLLAALTLHAMLSPDPETGRPRDPGTFGFCCMTGKKKRIEPKALPLFAGKTVRIVPHADAEESAAIWSDQLATVGARAFTYKRDGMTTDAGEPAKDLNDVVTTRGFAAYREQLRNLFSRV